MKREIKFRAWIYGLGKMTPVKEIDFDGYMSSVMVEINSERHEQMFFENTDYPDCELMQYTGLKDKNGKEVYEGDILKTWIGGYEQASPYVVEDMRKLYFELERDDSYYRIQKTEIIGNIYENPELLEVEDDN